MTLFKFLFGIILIQIASFALLFLTPPPFDTMAFIRLAIPLLMIDIGVAFWFNSLAQNTHKETLTKVKEDFALKSEAIYHKAQKSILKEAKITSAKANFKVGIAVASVVGIGALFVLAQMMTAGLLVLTASSGAVGGYYLRGKRSEKERIKKLEKSSDFKIIER